MVSTAPILLPVLEFFKSTKCLRGLLALVRGQIKHAAVVASPTIYCYQRYKFWSFALTNATWGENRTVAVHVKGIE